MPDGKESATSGASKRYGSEYRRGVDLPNAGSTEKSSSSSVMVVGLLSIRDAEAVQASLSSRLRCLSGSGGLRVPAADCKSRVLASDHAISDGDVIEARAAHATGNEARAAAEAAQEHAASRTASVTSAPHRDRRAGVGSTSANPTDKLNAAWSEPREQAARSEGLRSAAQRRWCAGRRRESQGPRPRNHRRDTAGTLAGNDIHNLFKTHNFLPRGVASRLPFQGEVD
jgi:hypothetical protein